MSRRSGRTRRRTPGRQKTTWSQVWPAAAVIAGGLAVAVVGDRLMLSRQVAKPVLPAWLPSCPVGSFPVDFVQRLETADGAIFFSCPRCIEQYRAAPEKYADAVRAQHADLAKLSKVQVACPVSGDVPDHSISRATRAGKILFCSEECAAIFDRDGDASLNLATAFTYQKTCPVSGQPIDPRWVVSVNENVPIFLCSIECVRQFRETPNEYRDELAAQGFRGQFWLSN